MSGSGLQHNPLYTHIGGSSCSLGIHLHSSRDLAHIHPVLQNKHTSVS